MGTLGPTRRFFSDRLMGRQVHFVWTVGGVIARVQGHCQAFDFGLVFSLATKWDVAGLGAPEDWLLDGQAVGPLVWNMLILFYI